MPRDSNEVLRRIETEVVRGDRSPGRTERVAEIIRKAGEYHWVGPTEIVAMAYPGAEAPAHPRFPLTQGPCAAAVATRKSVNVGDVRNDPRWLTTFSGTLSEIIVPVFATTGAVAGLIDVESEALYAFAEEDQRFLESCAGVMVPFFT